MPTEALEYHGLRERELCGFLRFSHLLIALNLSFLVRNMEVMPASLERFLEMSETMFVTVVALLDSRGQ